MGMTGILTPVAQETETARLAEYLSVKLAKGREALVEMEKYSQEQVDAMVKVCAKAVYDHAEELARDAVDETGMGCYDDKVQKNRNKSKLVWWSLRDKLSVGIIERNADTGIARVAKPVGVVAAVTPMTNPIVTPMSNAMFALKGGNPIIIAPHPKAMKCGIKTVGYINDGLKKLGVPEGALQILNISSMELTQMLLHSADQIIATGGMAMVRSVYSSGKPALGVGAGNVQCLVDRDVNYEEAVKMIVTGRGFDNGIICTGEQSAIIPREAFNDIMRMFSGSKAFVVPNNKRAALRDTIFPNGELNRALVGQDAPIIAKAAGMTVPTDTKILVVEAESIEDVLGSEKMYPVLTVYRYNDWDEAIGIARANLNKIGKGHSICIHSNNRANIERAALKCEVSRVVVNQSCALAGGGSFRNGLNPTNTLGCGTWGNNSISENLTYYHLLNISRISDVLEDRAAPPDDKVWA